MSQTTWNTYFSVTKREYAMLFRWVIFLAAGTIGLAITACNGTKQYENLPEWPSKVSVPAGYTLKEHRKERQLDLWIFAQVEQDKVGTTLIVVRSNEFPGQSLDEKALGVALWSTEASAGLPIGASIDSKGPGYFKGVKNEKIKNDLVILSGFTTPKTPNQNFTAMGCVAVPGTPVWVLVGAARHEPSITLPVTMMETVDGLCTDLREHGSGQ
jgi:hypothetical protein